MRYVLTLNGLWLNGWQPAPTLGSWSALASALDRAGITHPAGFTHTVVFRRCPACGERNVVHDGDYTCALCEAPLAIQWNFDDDRAPG